jgi:hypothetical protein
MHKKLDQKFLKLFRIVIYSEDHYYDNEYTGTFYKHFLTIYFLKFRIFYTLWRTGKDISGKINDTGFYKKGN